jgi:hypothetical protein
LAVLRRSAIAFAFCVLSALASFAQSPPGASSSPSPLGGFVPPYEILRTVRAAGFEPLAPALREGTTYVVRAIDFRGIPMRVSVDARSGAIREANRIVSGPGFSGPGLYGPYLPGPYAPVYYGRLATPSYPPGDDMESGNGRAALGATFELSPSDRLSSGVNLVPLPRPRPANVAGAKPVGRPDVATSAAPSAPQAESSSAPGKGAALPAIND